MTREKLMEQLDSIVPKKPKSAWSKYQRTIVDTAIKALEQELNIRNCFGCKYSKDNHNAGTEVCHLCMWENQYTPTTKNDLGVELISRKEVLKIFDEWFATCDIADKKDSPKIKIKTLPSVTPQEPRKGHWLGDSAGYKCDKCGHDLLEIAHSIDYIDFKKPNFCPNCGADMREVEE